MSGDGVRVTFTDGAGVVHRIRAADTPTVAVPGWRCGCGGERIAGTGRRMESRDTYASEARCVGCAAAVGTIRAKVSTLFGLEEDEAVMAVAAQIGAKIY